MRRSLLLTSLVALSSAPAAAWDAVLGVTFRVTSEVSLDASTDASTSTTRDQDAAPARPARTRAGPKQQWTSEGAVEGSQCQDDGDCQGWCREQRCVDTMSPAPPRIIPDVPAQACSEAAGCAPGLQCVQGQCMTPPPTVPAAPLQPCQHSAHCTDGEQCLEGLCVPPSSLRERGLELQLRARATELREELALGEGPLLTALAAHYEVDARRFGRVARAHRDELVAVMNADRAWPRRWVQQLPRLAAEARSGVVAPRVASW